MVGAGILMIGVSVGGCAGGEEPERDGPITYAGDAMVIESLTLDGDVVEHLGVSVTVPAGSSVSEMDYAQDTTTYEIEVAPGERVRLAVTPGAADDEEVALTSAVTGSILQQNGATLVEHFPLSWDAVEFGVATRAVLETDGGTQELLSIGGRDAGSTLAFSVGAAVSEGTLEDSVAYQVLRTLQVP